MSNSLAPQKRHEQLERWKQNEANVDLLDKQKSLENSSNKSNTSIQRDIGTKNYSDRLRDKTNTRFGLDGTGNSNISTTTNKRISSKRSKFKEDLQVKFSNDTLFLTACTNGDLNECERLLDNNLVDVNVTTSDGITGLHEAAICGNVGMVEFLLQRGANINCCDNEGWTPLHAAASLGKSKIVSILLEHGADPTMVTCENLLAFDLARNDDVQSLIAERLRDHDIDALRAQEERAIESDIDRWIETGQYEERSHPVTKATVLHVIAAKGYVKLMKRILEVPSLKKKINLEAKDCEGFTPLLAASFWSQMEIVDLLIENGANIFAQANNGYKIGSIHLKNYQQKKLQQPQQNTARGSRTSIQSDETDSGAESRRSTLGSTDTSANDLGDARNLRSGSAARLIKQQQQQGLLSRSQSLDVDKQPPENPLLQGTMSVDRLLLRCESMTERELRKSYKELVMENELLRQQLKELDSKEKQKQQDWIRKERQLQRKISELEEETKQVDQWKQEIQRLKDENVSLIRVVSKLSKQTN